MKNLFSFLSLLIIYKITHAQVIQTDLEKMNLKGNVYSVELKSYLDDYSQNAPGANAEDMLNQYLEFNEAGNLTLKKEFDEAGLVSTDSFVYNPKGLLVLHVQTGKTYNIGFNRYFETRYDSSNRKTETLCTYQMISDTIIRTETSRNEFIYNKSGEPVEIRYWKNDSVYMTTEYSYHPNGYLKTDHTQSKNSPYHTLTTFDEKGRVIESDLIGYNKKTFTYFPNGEKEKIALGLYQITFTCKYVYDSRDNWVRQIQIPDSDSYPYSRYLLTRHITYR